MSSNTTLYVVLGVQLPYGYFTEEERDGLDPFRDNTHKREVGQKDGITVIEDGMCGGYTVVGHVLAKARMDEGDGLENSILSLDGLEAKTKVVYDKLVTHFGITLPRVVPIVLTHYS
ncbi:hypothetical protein SKUL_35 [Pseudomonas phage Skulduggery]|uniref:Uncharacterized protein n=1 Tax=Pseudomonas phage Skulduggery TaxID=2006671 RepID=A0A1Y0SX13_9CAUD|nr:hypothetical protein PP627_gp35 [Pseudomonas phage Skulduggery]ARV77134.1 hypothetical protein SKUL_35 [Pseudomonas phage Skulduggery]